MHFDGFSFILISFKTGKLRRQLKKKTNIKREFFFFFRVVDIICIDIQRTSILATLATLIVFSVGDKFLIAAEAAVRRDMDLPSAGHSQFPSIQLGCNGSTADQS